MQLGKASRRRGCDKRGDCRVCVQQGIVKSLVVIPKALPDLMMHDHRPSKIGYFAVLFQGVSGGSLH
jgi:hypothetical protein